MDHTTVEKQLAFSRVTCIAAKVQANTSSNESLQGSKSEDTDPWTSNAACYMRNGEHLFLLSACIDDLLVVGTQGTMNNKRLE